MTAQTTTLLLVPLLAVLAPIITRVFSRWVAVPGIVFELLLGIAVGPAVLNLVHPSDFLETLSKFGVVMLFFMAGTELDAAAMRDRTGRMAWAGWLLSFAVGTALGAIIAPGMGAVIIGIALSSTALGTLIPVLRDSGELQTPFGRTVGAVGAVGEFGPIIAVSVVLSERSTLAAVLVLAAFAVIAVLAIRQAGRASHGRLHRFVENTMHTSGQFAVRLVILIVAALVALSLALKVDILLGAFTAGIVWKLLISDAAPETRDQVESKIEGLAFGFLIPVFFITTGIDFDLKALLAQPWTFAVVPAVTLLLLLVRGLPSSTAVLPGTGRAERMSVALMGATGLPMIIVATSAGVSAGHLSSTAAAVLVGGGMLSVLLYPALAATLRSRTADPNVPTPDDDDPAGTDPDDTGRSASVA
ncbi:MAG: cation:proton antiporter [Gordonia sp. (in: high G+C Gram-positive bacteria)]|uniref:cation:proton antiporter n=1 Tax=Gordonia sp. (in: high G+C Gram-positive bacteria) TaxID=84139 RepID=UPI0039E3E3B9